MTKEQKLRRNSLAADFGGKEDDLILADLDLMLDEVEPSPVPLNHFLDDEDVINRLLIGANYDANEELELAVSESDATVIDDISLADELAEFDKFIVEPIEQKEQNQQVETEEISALDIRLVTDFDEIPAAEDAIDRLLVDTGFNANNELKEDDGAPEALLINDISRGNEFDVNYEEQNTMAADAGIFDSEESGLAIDKDTTDVFLIKEKNQEQDISETKYPEEALEPLNNDAGIIALSSVRSDQEYFKKQINDYEHKVNKAAIITYASLIFGIVALLSTVVLGVIVSGLQTKVSKLTELVSILEEDMTSITEKNPEMEINNSDSSIEKLDHKVNGLTDQSEEQLQISSGMLKSEMTTVTPEHAGVNKSIDNQKIKSHVMEKKKQSEAAVNNILPEKKANNTQTDTGWSVNLTAYEDISYAKSKAAKFIQKAIPVKVIAVDMNNTTWYRLKVGGFKNKEEATSYAAKIKKSLNLNSVSVGNN